MLSDHFGELGIPLYMKV